MSLFKKSIEKEIEELLILLIDIGYKEEYQKEAKEFLTHNELGLSFETIVAHLDEFEIKITDGLFNKIKGIAKRMEISESNFSFLKELIK